VTACSFAAHDTVNSFPRGTVTSPNASDNVCGLMRNGLAEVIGCTCEIRQREYDLERLTLTKADRATSPSHTCGHADWHTGQYGVLLGEFGQDTPGLTLDFFLRSHALLYPQIWKSQLKNKVIFSLTIGYFTVYSGMTIRCYICDQEVPTWDQRGDMCKMCHDHVHEDEIKWKFFPFKIPAG
jgi:hypothetical protein